MYDTVIVGSGPAGLTAGIYAKRAGLECVVIENTPIGGGQIATTDRVDNYPGLLGVNGMDLGMKFREHAEKLGCEFKDGQVVEIEDKGSAKIVKLQDGSGIETKTVILALGADHRQLGVPGENELRGKGVSYCATCDGAFFRGKDVAVVGGGDVALEDAAFLSRFASKVYLIHRRNEFRGAKALADEAASKENVTFVFDTIVTKVDGENSVTGVETENKKTGEKGAIPVNGVFMAVGTKPNVEGIAGLPEADEKGYITAGEDCVTSIPGIFVAGDLRTKQLRQVITAAADGANAVTSVQKYLSN
ncbi:MAG: thioredoxin-disulfide reductase [Lachnospiraceae bacterium]|uniref:Thioredoxin reductase n=1 Tax=Candidatus Weimeria bifida TaxID=2599074 RepID=A0A6N7J2I3_9FIRM|nr:thioredoxin-disulfide reductase [Candidatus Weimeria bifida]RRF97362.1 MAG: thioredoxin-disulfide reductase [Lachnospiraceae bacterium]